MKGKKIVPAPRAGFSIMELLTVVVIVGVLAGLLLPALGRMREQARRTRAESEINQIVISLQMYADDYGVYPEDDGGALTCRNLMDVFRQGDYGEWELPPGESLEDPWGNPYVYIYDTGPVRGSGRGIPFNVFSLGPDGIQGTEDDIGNW